VNDTLRAKEANELPRAASQSLAVVCARVRIRATVRTKGCVVDLILMVKGGHKLHEAKSQSLAL